MTTALQRIDAHQHFWRLQRGDYRWLRADVPALAPIHRDVEPDDLRPLLERHNVVKTIAVQAADSEAETEHLLALARAHDFIAGVVGWVDLADEASVAPLARWADEKALKGVRPMLQDLPEHDWIATRPHPAAVRELMRQGLRFDALVQPWHLASLLRFVDAWPALPVIVDHAAKPQLASGWSARRPAVPKAGQPPRGAASAASVGAREAPWADEWHRGMRELARRPQVWCKVSGLLTEAATPARAGGDAGFEAIEPVWQTLLELFGPQRLVWGSDWPVLELAADYGRWVSLSERLFAGLSEAERRSVWHDNAVRFYGL
jgi:L-fuconolactonase